MTLPVDTPLFARRNMVCYWLRNREKSGSRKLAGKPQGGWDWDREKPMPPHSQITRDFFWRALFLVVPLVSKGLEHRRLSSRVVVLKETHCIDDYMLLAKNNSTATITTAKIYLTGVGCRKSFFGCSKITVKFYPQKSSRRLNSRGFVVATKSSNSG